MCGVSKGKVSLQIFFAERAEHTIFAGDVDADAKVTNVKKLPIHGLVYPRNLAVDWISNKLYIVETGSRRIDVSDFQGTYRTVVVADDLTLPIDVALDPLVGYSSSFAY